jgi:hypothetical protein
MAYLGKTPSQAVRSRYYFTASGGETSLSPSEVTGLSFTDANYVDVSLNGVALVSGTNYTATPSTNTIGSLAALTASDVVEIVVYDTFSVFGGNVNGDFNISGGTLAAEAVTVTGLTTTGNINFGDNDRAIFGAGSDLQIYHSGSASFIRDTGTGSLQIEGENAIYLANNGGTELYAAFNVNGASSLYYDNAAKLATTSTGIDVTGTVTMDGATTSANINFGDNDKANFGAGNDLQIYHNGSASIIQDVGSGDLFLAGDNNVTITNSDFSENKAKFISNGGAVLYYNNNPTVTVTSTGVDVTGTLTVDGVESTCAAGDANQALLAYHPTSTSTRTIAKFQSNVGGTQQDKVVIKCDGSVGIGTSSPDVPLNVESATSATKIKYAGTSNTHFGLQIESNISGGNFESDFANGTTAMLDLFANSATTSGGDLFVARTQASDPVLLVKGNGNVGIGTAAPQQLLHLKSHNPGGKIRLEMGQTGVANTDVTGEIEFYHNDASGAGVNASIKGICTSGVGAGALTFGTGTTSTTERMRINNSGNVTVGKTDTGSDVVGCTLRATGRASFTMDGNGPLVLNRKSSDGDIVFFQKDNATVGAISTASSYLAIGDDCGLLFNNANPSFTPFNVVSSSNADNSIDLGVSNARFDDIFATNSTIQTSDQNEKEQIASLTTAEMTAAKAISKLFKTFKWQDKVAAKGDAARRHVGVIAQEVQTAMTNAGLDAADYAFWCSDTWWETSTDVAAIEADEEAGIEARDAYTRIDTYKTADEAPEGATQRTRLGIRYPELLAFIGAATEQRLTDIEARLTALENAD